MKKILLLFSCQIIIFFRIGFGQNLVPNGGFENYSSCPDLTCQIYKATGWFQPLKTAGSNSVVLSSNSDYFNSCVDSTTVGVPNNFIGFQNSRSGNGYIGITLYTPWLNQNAYREYAEVKLNQTLLANKKYNLKYFVSLANDSRYSITRFDAHLSNDSLLYTSNSLYNIPVIPQIQFNGRISDTLNWVEVSGSFIAVGNENYLTLGNFHDGALCDSLRVRFGPTMNCCVAYYYIDDVSLEEDTITGINENSEIYFSIYPNPAKNIIQLNSQQIIQEIRVMDFRQRSIVVLKPNKANLEIDISQLEDGIYIALCKFQNGELIYRKLVVQH